jgi:hypothetical protein
MDKEIKIERPVGGLMERRDLLSRYASGSGPQPMEPNAPALHTAAASSGDAKPLIGACTIGCVMSNNSRRSVRGHM